MSRLPLSRYSNEFKVGLLALVALVGAAWAILRTDDRPGSVRGYELVAIFDSVQGIYVTTQVRVAGVSIGSVRGVDLDPGGGRLKLEIQGGVQLPVDSVAELKGEGVLGDRYVHVVPGTSAELLAPGDVLRTRSAGTDLDELQAKMGLLADDLQAITAALRLTLEQDRPQDSVARALDNVDRLTARLDDVVATNQADVAAIADNVRQLTASLDALVDRLGGQASDELEALRQATTRLDSSLQRLESAAGNVDSITGKIDQGEGTLGRLVNDDAAMDRIEDTLGDVGELVDSVSGLHTGVYYRGSVYLGTDPDSAGFTENPVAGDSRNAIGIEIQPREDYWYLVEIVDHPVGAVTYTEHYLPETGARWTEYERQPKYLFSFMFAKRYRDLVLRLGVKDSAGGFGLDYLAFRDRFALSADLYDFEFGSWPVLDGTPNLSLNGRVTPLPHLYLEGGLYNVLLGARHGFVTPYFGGGIRFTDRDLKWVLSAVPFPG